MAEGAREEVRYTAFLSYSHKDAAAAGKLHRRLESYRLPKRLVGKETPRGIVPDRLSPIFRDRDELPAASDLSETVRTALGQSGSLIILCSPYAAESLWVAEEIRVFRELHPDRPILAAILDGDPPACFPEALRAFGQDGTWHEPLATDLRPQADGAHLGLLKLVAGITGVGLDELVQRDAARRIRRVMTVTAAAVVAMLIMAALAIVAFEARREADRQRAEAEGLIEFMLTDLRDRLSSVGRLDIMASVNQRALAYYDKQQQLTGRPADSAMWARVKHSIGATDLDRGDRPAALAALREAHLATSRLIEASPNDVDVIFAHAQGEYWLGYFDYRRRNFGAARAAWQRYKALTDRLLAIDADNPRWLREAGFAEGDLCTAAMTPPVNARVALQTCAAALTRIEQVRRLLGADPATVKDLANRHGWMVDVWIANGNWERALQHRRAHERLVQALLRREPDSLEYRDIWMQSQLGFGEQLAAHGNRQEARRRFDDAARMIADMRRHDPSNEFWRGLQQRISQAIEEVESHGTH
jgi:hypothetical protein